MPFIVATQFKNNPQLSQKDEKVELVFLPFNTDKVIVMQDYVEILGVNTGFNHKKRHSYPVDIISLEFHTFLNKHTHTLMIALQTQIVLPVTSKPLSYKVHD